MTGPAARAAPIPGPTSAHWCAAVADALTEAGSRVGRLSEQVARDWPDAVGREWAERAARLRHELGRQVIAAVELGEVLARRAASDRDPDAPPPLGGPVTGPSGAPRSGMRLGSTAAARTDDDRGMRIAELPPESAQPG